MQGKKKALQSANKTRQSKRQSKDSHKIEQLKAYVSQSKYIPLNEQTKVCASFGLPYKKRIFEKEYSRRIFKEAFKQPVTRAEITKKTGIEEKYICQVKRRLEKAGKLKVLFLDFCTACLKNNIQRFSTNKDHWIDENILPKSNQLNLFSFNEKKKGGGFD